MALIPGSHWTGPLLGDGRSGGGIAEDMPADLVSRRDVFCWFEDFMSADSYSAALWAETTVGVVAGNTLALADEPMGVLLVNPGTAVSTGYGGVRRNGTDPMFLNPRDIGDGTTGFLNGVLAWEARVKVDLIANGSFVIGIGIEDATIITSAGASNWASSYSIHMLDGGALRARGGDAGAASVADAIVLPAGFAMTNNTWARIGMRIFWVTDPNDFVTGGMEVYFNDRRFGVTNANQGVDFPIPVMTPGFGCVNDAANNIDMRLDYFWVGMKRAIS